MKTETEVQVPFDYGRMWPRDIFYRRLEKEEEDVVPHKGKKRLTSLLFRTIEVLKEPGVYILYRDDVPYYVGQAKRLRSRLWNHACVADARYFNHCNFFSFFVIKGDGDDERSKIESVLIAAMPTANGARPLRRKPFPPKVREMVREIQSGRANPLVRKALKRTAENEEEP